jgi:hypothetical protein
MGVRYIHRMQDNDWVFWDEYTETYAHDIVNELMRTPTMPSKKQPAPPMDTVDIPIPDVSDDTPSLTPTTYIPAPGEHHLTQFDVAVRQADNNPDTSDEDECHGNILPMALTQNVSPMSTASNLGTPHRYGTETLQQRNIPSPPVTDGY